MDNEKIVDLAAEARNRAEAPLYESEGFHGHKQDESARAKVDEIVELAQKLAALNSSVTEWGHDGTNFDHEHAHVWLYLKNLTFIMPRDGMDLWRRMNELADAVYIQPAGSGDGLKVTFTIFGLWRKQTAETR